MRLQRRESGLSSRRATNRPQSNQDRGLGRSRFKEQAISPKVSQAEEAPDGLTGRSRNKRTSSGAGYELVKVLRAKLIVTQRCACIVVALQ